MNLPKFYLVRRLNFSNADSISSDFTGELVMSNKNLDLVLNHVENHLDEIEFPDTCLYEKLKKYHLVGDYFLIWMTDGDIDSIAKYLHDQLDKMTSNAYNLQIIEEDYINRMHVWPTSDIDEESIFSDLVRESFYDHIHKISY